MDIRSGEDILRICAEEGVTISDVMRRFQAEQSGHTVQEVDEQMSISLKVMRTSVHEPLDEPKKSMGGLIGGQASALRARRRAGETLLGPLAARAASHAMAVLEQNASMGVIVATPTAGSSGVLPGVLFAIEEEKGITEQQIINGLYCAGAVGMIFMKNASVSGAEAGCQAEIGVGSAMAAAAATEIMGGTPEQCLNAAALAISNMLGLVCDPVAGLVECPCQTRNAMGAVNALLSADIALSGIPCLIPFDEMVEAMMRVGRSIPFELRETALGGCAATPTGQMWQKKIFGDRA